MRKSGLLSGLFVLSLVLTCGARAQSLKQQEMITRDTAKVADLARETNQACGTAIRFQVDYPSYAHVLDDDNNQSPWAYLANVTDALKRVCRSDAGKQAVKAKIMAVTAVYGETETEALSNGEFRYIVPYRGHGPSTVVAWLESNL